MTKYKHYMFTRISKNTIEYDILCLLIGKDMVLRDLFNYSYSTEDTFYVIKDNYNISIDIEMEHTSARKLRINIILTP